MNPCELYGLDAATVDNLERLITEGKVEFRRDFNTNGRLRLSVPQQGISLDKPSVDALRDALKECSDDLETEIEVRYARNVLSEWNAYR